MTQSAPDAHRSDTRQSLYEQDYQQWLEQTVQHLRDRQVTRALRAASHSRFESGK